jgi:hypothetical protein
VCRLRWLGPLGGPDGGEKEAVAVSPQRCYGARKPLQQASPIVLRNRSLTRNSPSAARLRGGGRVTRSNCSSSGPCKRALAAWRCGGWAGPRGVAFPRLPHEAHGSVRGTLGLQNAQQAPRGPIARMARCAAAHTTPLRRRRVQAVQGQLLPARQVPTPKTLQQRVVKTVSLCSRSGRARPCACARAGATQGFCISRSLSRSHEYQHAAASKQFKERARAPPRAAAPGRAPWPAPGGPSGCAHTCEKLG